MKIKYKKIYSFNIIDCIKKNKDVYMLDRENGKVCPISDMNVYEFFKVIESDETNRYDFWIEEREDSKDE